MIKIIKTLFESNWTKWYPFVNYSYGGNDRFIMIKKNKKTGMVKFKVIKIQDECLNTTLNFKINSKDVFDTIFDNMFEVKEK